MSKKSMETIFKEINNENSLLYSQTIQKISDEQLNFKYTTIDRIIKNLYNEVEELKEEIFKENIDKERIQSELGDVIFSLCNISNFFEINSNDAIISSNNEFKRRIVFVEKELILQNRNFKDVDEDELNILWKKAKNINNK